MLGGLKWLCKKPICFAKAVGKQEVEATNSRRGVTEKALANNNSSVHALVYAVPVNRSSKNNLKAELSKNSKNMYYLLEKTKFIRILFRKIYKENNWMLKGKEKSR